MEQWLAVTRGAATLPRLLLLASAWRWAAADAFGGYSLVESYVGPEFFSKFHFWTGPDPSHGTVDYTGYEEALARGMLRASDAEVYMSVDAVETIPVGEGRRSIRIQSRNAYNAGLFVLRLSHAPTGCATWPAFWMYGEDSLHSWPTWGEFDIIEGVHQQSHTRTTLHTAPSCTQEAIIEGEDFGGHWEGGSDKKAANICDVDAPDEFANQGCSQRGPEGSFGAGFNRNGGGTFAAEWDPVEGHISTWFWPVGEEPLDLQPNSGASPLPELWGKPFSHFKLHPMDCPPQHFLNMRLVFNIDFCGDYADSVWGQGCPELAKRMTCMEFVAGHPEEFVEAHWTISGLDVFQKSGPLPANLGERIIFDFKGAQPPAKPAPVQQTAARFIAMMLLICGLSGMAFFTLVEHRRQQQYNEIGMTDGRPGWPSAQRSMELVVAEVQAAGERLQTWISVALGSRTGNAGQQRHRVGMAPFVTPQEDARARTCGAQSWEDPRRQSWFG